MDTQNEKLVQTQSSILLLLGIGIGVLVFFGIIFSFQSHPASSPAPTDVPQAVVVKHIKLVHYLANGKQEVVDFDCNDILTRLQVNKTNTITKKETLKTSQQNLASLCQTIGAKVGTLQDSYGISDGKKYDYALTIVTETGTKTIYFNLASEETPELLSSLVTILETATGVPITPTGDIHLLPISSPKPSSFPTPVPTADKKSFSLDPTVPPALCSGYLGPPGSRPVVQSNTVCTP